MIRLPNTAGIDIGRSGTMRRHVVLRRRGSGCDMPSGDPDGFISPVATPDPRPDSPRRAEGGHGHVATVSILAWRVAVWAFLYVAAAIGFTLVRDRWLLFAVVAVLGVVITAQRLHEAAIAALDEARRRTDRNDPVIRGVRKLPLIGGGAAALLVFVGITRELDGLVFFGFAAGYIALALEVDVLRDSFYYAAPRPSAGTPASGAGTAASTQPPTTVEWWAREWRGWLVAIGVFLLTAGVLLYAVLNGSMLLLAYLVLGAGAVSIGVGLTLTSEPKLCTLCEERPLYVWKVRIGHARRVALVGLLLYAAGIGVLWWLLDLVGFVIAAGVLLLAVTLALVARSNSDVMIVLAMAALVWVLTQQSVPRNEAQNIGNGNRVVVALGDSYISGEGAVAYFEGTNDPRDNPRGEACRRAPTAYPNLLTEEDHTDLPRRLLFLACSGDTASELVKEADDEDGQLYETAREIRDKDLRVDFVLLSIGGNDALFGNVGNTCVGPGDCSDIGDAWIDNVTDDVAPLLDDAYEAVRQAVGEGPPVLVIPYPIPLSDDDDCEYAPLTGDEREFIVLFGQHLNDVIEQRAVRAGFHFVDTVEGAFDGHKICQEGVSAGETAANLFAANSVTGTIEQSVNPTNWFHNSLHPNAFGHQLLRTKVLEWIARHPDFRTTAPGAPGVPAPTAGEIKNEIEESGDAAARQGGDVRCAGDRGAALQDCTQRWARQQLALGAVPGGIALGVTSVGAWLLSLAAIHRWRRLFNPDWCHTGRDLRSADTVPPGPVPQSV
jgi:lysophospholipase L1-like esterase